MRLAILPFAMRRTGVLWNILEHSGASDFTIVRVNQYPHNKDVCA